MIRWTHSYVAIALTTLAVSLGGCRGDDAPGESATASESSSSTSLTSTDSATSTTGISETSSTSSSTGADTEASAGFLTTQTSSSSGGGALPNGEQCESDADCVSMNCYEIPMFGGVCSECNSDDDCIDSGAGISCSLDAGSMQAVCTEGGLGTTCESQESCADPLICGEVIPGTFGLVPTSCGECGESSDCKDGQICSPKVDFMMLNGYLTCVEESSVPNNELCPTNDEGNLACESGKCGDVSVMGFINLGVCGECLNDEDCMDGTCTPGAFEGGIMGSVCS